MKSEFFPRRLPVDIALLTCLSFGTLFFTASMALEPKHPERGVAVLFAPWTSAEDAMARTVEAGGRFVRFGGPVFVTVAVPDDAGYPARIRAAGAWLVADPQALAACLSPFAGRAEL